MVKNNPNFICVSFLWTGDSPIVFDGLTVSRPVGPPAARGAKFTTQFGNFINSLFSQKFQIEDIVQPLSFYLITEVLLDPRF
jgi:hypothetical protein